MRSGDISDLAGVWEGTKSINQFIELLGSFECILDEESIMFDKNNRHLRMKFLVADVRDIERSERRLIRARNWLTVSSVEIRGDGILQLSIQRSQGIGYYNVSDIRRLLDGYRIQCDEEMHIDIEVIPDVVISASSRNLGPESGYFDEFFGYVRTGLKLSAVKST